MLRYKLTELIEEKKYQEKRKITLEDVSNESGVGTSTLVKMRQNKGDTFKTDVIDKLCAYFQCSTCDLVEYHD